MNKFELSFEIHFSSKLWFPNPSVFVLDMTCACCYVLGFISYEYTRIKNDALPKKAVSCRMVSGWIACP